MDDAFDIQAYLTRGVEAIVAEPLKTTLRDPRESASMLKFAAASQRASGRWAQVEKAREHIPPFLIASITRSRNLYCALCYSRCDHATVDAAPVSQISAEEWLGILREADDMG